MLKLKYVISFLASLWCSLSIAQLVTSSNSPSSLVQDVLLGPGVTVSNITFNGSSGAIGQFTATGSNLGIGSGIVMTTGTIANNGAGPQGPNNQAASGVNNNYGGSGLLSSIIGGNQTYNAVTLEFDFVPYSDTVRFKYVFGSEEYPEYAPPNNASFNDVFGFFISGPGISGLQNIAKLPTGAIVSINNVNAITNSSYFIPNGDGSSAPQNGSAYYIQYDGFTKVLEAVSKVQCGKTYHLILSIADVGDGLYDSGIFLQANSLTSKIPIEVEYDLSQTLFSDPDMMAESCVSTTVTVQRGANSNNNTSLTIPINVTGTATEGVDYTNIPATVTLAPGQNSTSFVIDAFGDALVEGNETINLEFLITDPCGNVNPLTIDLSIADVQPVAVTVEDDTVLCSGDIVTLTALASGGAPPYTYVWSTSENSSSIAVSPTATTTYTVSVTDNCINQTATDNATVTVPVYPPLDLNESSDITEICPYVNAILQSNASGGAGNYTYQWTSDQGQTLGTSANQSVTPSTTTTYTVMVTDQCGSQTSADILYTITSPPLILTMSPNVEICPGDSIQISVNATGGYGQYYYHWVHSGETTPQIWVYPESTTTYRVIVSDECQTFSVSGSTTVTIVKPTADFLISSHTLFNDLPITFMNLSQNAVSYQWTFGDGNSSTMIHPNNLYEEPGDYIVTLIAIDEKGCLDSISKPIHIKEEFYIYVPNTFTPDGQRINETFKASTIGIKYLQTMIFNRWGETVFSSEELDFEWDGTFQGAKVQDGTYIWKIKFVTNEGLERTITGHINLIR